MVDGFSPTSMGEACAKAQKPGRRACLSFVSFPYGDSGAIFYADASDASLDLPFSLRHKLCFGSALHGIFHGFDTYSVFVLLRFPKRDLPCQLQSKQHNQVLKIVPNIPDRG